LSDNAPKRLKEQPDSGAAAATSDRVQLHPTVETATQLSGAYDSLVKFGFSLLHLAEVKQERSAPGTGRYMVRAWIEPLQSTSLKDIESVTYQVWPDFGDSTFETRSQESNFDLWISIYGEFPLLALVKLKNGEEFILQRYLDLPGRPPD
jgi:hypothetical protein